MSYKFLSTILGIDANFTGLVGIGTTSPANPLTILKSANSILLDGIKVERDPSTVSSAIFNAFGGAANIISNSGQTSVFSPILFRASDNTTTNELMRITGSGNVGIGTTSPSGLLHLYKNNAPVVLRLQSASPYAYPGDFSIQTGGYGSNDFIIFDNAAATERLYINSSGRVGIGTTSPATKLHVDASGYSILASYDAGNRRVYMGLDGVGEPSIQGTLSNGTARQLNLNPAGGNVLIGTSTDAGYKLDVNGTSMFRGVTQHNSDVVLNGNRLYIGSHLGNTVLRPISTTNLQLFNSNAGATLFLDANGAVQIGQSNAVTWAYFTASGNTLYNTTTLPSLAGTGTRMVVADATGILSTQAVPTGTVTGSGTTNYISKWTSSSGLGNSLVYDNGTNVGIGTTTPTYTLDITGAIIQTARLNSVGTDTRLYFHNTTTGTTTNDGLLIGMISSDTYFYNYENGNSIFGTNNVERMRISSGGNVLIATTTDSGYKLDVSGFIRMSGTTYSAILGGISSSWGGNSGYPTLYGQTDDRWVMHINPHISYTQNGVNGFAGSMTGSTIRFASNPAASNYWDIGVGVNSVGTDTFSIGRGGLNYMKLTATGNVGIGATSPAQKLDVDGLIRSNRTSNTDGALILGTTGTYLYAADSGGYLASYTANLERLRITSGGNVGIGTTNPSEKLEVDGGSSSVYIKVKRDVGYALLGAGLNFNAIYSRDNSNNPKTLYIESANVLIGTTTDNGDKLQVTGNTTLGIGANRPVRYDSNGGNFRITPNPGGWATGYFFNGSSGTYRGGFGSYGDYDSLIYYWIGSDYNIPTLMVQPNQGNVGIGTTTPGVRLVNSGAPISVSPTLGSGTVGSQALLSANGLYGMYSGVSNSGDVWHQVQRNDGNTTVYNLLLQPSGGNVLIGSTTTFHSSLLTVAGKLFLQFAPNADIGGTMYGYNDTSYASYEGGIKFQSFKWNGSGYGMADAMTINGQGNVGIGTTSPTEKVDIRGVIRVSNNGVNDSGIIAFGNYLNGAGYYDNGIFRSSLNSISTPGNTLHIGSYEALAFTTSAAALGSQSVRMYISGSTGNVLIGTTTDYGYKLFVNGDIANTTSVNSTGDAGIALASGNRLGFNESGVRSWTMKANSGNLNVYSGDGNGLYVIHTGAKVGSLAGSGTRMVVADSAGTLSTQAIPGGGSANGSWQDNNTQTATASLTGYGVEFSTLNFRTGVNVIPDTGGRYTLIQMTDAGRYDIQFSFQFQNLSSSAQDVYVWLRKNGENTPDDIPNSNTLLSIPAKHGSGTPGHTVAAWNFFVEAAPLDYYQIAWATNDITNVTMEYYNPTAFCPGTPSAILTVNQVD